MVAHHAAEYEDVPIVKLVDKLLCAAINSFASDIHLEPHDKGLRIRFRIDGILYDHDTVEQSVMQQVLSRLKVLARINIAEKRIPQDGKFIMNVDNNLIDLRVSTFPSLYGEKIVVRILDRSKNMISLSKLGLSDGLFTKFCDLIHKSSGFFLVTGPTGSGKTTTLYAALSALNAPDKNIITLEDPVEYNLEGITQGQIKPEAGFTFEKGIRSLLRQDPDIIMVGEIRDKQTARIAIQAALTGHLVFSTVHTNDAPSVIIRLMDMGIEPFLINAAINGVLAQRLVRTICTHCRIKVMPEAEEQVILNRLNIKLTALYKGKGCNECNNTGYKGRTGVFELLVMTSQLRSLIVQNPSSDAIYAQTLHDGMQPLLLDGIQKVKEGVISVQELIRVAA